MVNLFCLPACLSACLALCLSFLRLAPAVVPPDTQVRVMVEAMRWQLGWPPWWSVLHLLYVDLQPYSKVGKGATKKCLPLQTASPSCGCRSQKVPKLAKMATKLAKMMANMAPKFAKMATKLAKMMAPPCQFDSGTKCVVLV